MGIQQSKSTKEKQLEEKKQLLQKYGILLPPSFGTCTDSYPHPIPCKPSLQSNTFQWIENQGSFNSSSLDVMKYSTPCIRLFNDNDKSVSPVGISLNVNTISSSISTSLYKQQRDKPLSGEMVYGQLFQFNSIKSGIGLKVNNDTKVMVKYGGFVRHDPSGLGLFLSTNGLNQSYIGWNLLTTLSNDVIWLGSSLQLPSQTNTNPTFLTNVLNSFKSNNVSNKDLLNSISHVKTWVGVKAFNGSLKASIEYTAQIPSNNDILKDIYANSSYFLSYQVNNGNNIPPTTFTTYNTPSKSSQTYILSQVLYYDRYVINPVETRCPKIRNAVTWGMKMEQSDQTSTCAMFAWQLNRNLAIQCKLHSNGVLSKILFKRWAYPRVLSTISATLDLSSFSIAFHGIGFVVDTGSNEDVRYNNQVFLNKGERDGPDMKYTLVLDDDVNGNEQCMTPPLFV